MATPNTYADLLGDFTRNAIVGTATGGGGYGKSSPWMDALRYAGAVGSALAGVRQKGIVPALLEGGGNVAKIHAQRQFNQYVQDQQRQALLLQQQQNANNAGLYTDVTGLTLAHPNAGVDASVLNMAAPLVRKNNANPAWSAALQGKEVDLEDMKADYGELPAILVNRANAVNDANATLSQLPEFAGRQPFFGGKPFQELALSIVNPQQFPNLSQAMQPQLDPGQVSLQASARKGNAVTPGQALQFGIPNVDQMLTGRKNEFGIFDDYRDTNEAIRSNKANEGIDMYGKQTDRMTAEDQRRLGYWKRPPGGGSSGDTPLETGIKQQQYMENQLQMLDTLEQDLTDHGIRTGVIDKKTGALKPSAPGYAGFIKELNKVQRKKTDINAAMLGGGGAFGGGSREKLQQATTERKVVKGSKGTYTF